ncbi:calcium-binding protein [Bradyrhizobium brasilense]|uniref:Calcium-binding protein n=1 Tax=Bradyrhizobium brasilense TaxID=1419277 RepID=A0ABY8JS10_9BRAD|nr:calcium-binding protein [Bradyrhizobium brasilense]WFU66858.1 calcium-binding protein [Bradyrhizobium brasilense]
MANYLVGGIGNDSIFGHDGNDALWGDAGNDSLDGGDGNDELFGGPGNDIMTGGTGNDIFHVDSIGDSVIELANGGTADEVRTALNNYVLPSQVENLKLEGGTAALNATGNSLNNTMTGNLGNNTLSGAGGNDTLLGGQGNDVLIGGAGKHTTTGGGGLDRMVISSLSDSGTAFAQRDVINTFAHGDKIDLTGIDANTNVAGNQAFQFVDNFSHVAGQLQWDLTGVSATGVKGYLVQSDVNGDAIADFSRRSTPLPPPIYRAVLTAGISRLSTSYFEVMEPRPERTRFVPASQIVCRGGSPLLHNGRGSFARCRGRWAVNHRDREELLRVRIS